MKNIKTAIKKSRLGKPVRWICRNIRSIRRAIAGVDNRIIRQYLSSAKERKLQLGCGSNILEGWLNTDFFPKPDHVAHIDATRPYPFNADTFDFIFSEHMIEHLPHTQVEVMLKECYRVLKKGGKIRISTPDLLFLITLYQREKTELQQRYVKWAVETGVRCPIGCEDTFIINQFVRSWGHTFIYDEKTLRCFLEKAGFREITKCDLNDSTSGVLRGLENERRMPEGLLKLESLTLEGTK